VDIEIIGLGDIRLAIVRIGVTITSINNKMQSTILRGQDFKKASDLVECADGYIYKVVTKN
jgi:hypothetical protein